MLFLQQKNKTLEKGKLPCWKYLWLTMFLICFLSHENNLQFLCHNNENALKILFLLASRAAASAANNSAQHEKSSISMVWFNKLLKINFIKK